MPKTLIVMRHAKSDWSTPGTDAERPLNARGRAAATALGDWLRRQNLTPDTVLCSAAERTQETAARLKLDIAITPLQALYLASSDQIMAQLQGASGDTILIVGHNPGIGDFAERLCKIRPDHPRFRDFPTGATAVYDCDITDWADVTVSRARLTQFITPHDLPG